MKLLKTSYLITACLFMFSMVSCNSWLDVKPKKLVEEEDLFSSENGFKEALTGIYLKMSKKEMYGKELSYGFLDCLGQYYQPNYNGENEFQSSLYYTFPSYRTESYTESIWKSCYNTIANINNLLKWIEQKREVLTTPGYYEIIKGEALALRAFIHFDLLRMYGPVYSQNKNTKSIPYRTELNPESMEILPATKAIEYILKDLHEADTLLVNDPLSFEFPKFEYDEEEMEGDRFLVYRFHRMNLYAVKALLARVNLYCGNKEDARKHAQEVLDSKLFKLVRDNTIDKVYSTELIFSMYVPRFEEQVENDFSMGRAYYISERSFLDEIFDTRIDGRNDIRYKAYSQGNKDIFLRKYKQENMWVSTEGTIPLIRLSEIYYILAESAENINESAEYLNMVRDCRGIDAIQYTSEEEKNIQLEKEYRKEFAGEGQLFFFYKRNFKRTFLHCPLNEMTEKNYVFNLPENEILFGQQSEN